MMKPKSVRGTRGRTSAALRFATALAMGVALLGTTGCGQKGPLYLPEPAPVAVPAPGDAPGDTSSDAKEKQKRDAAGNNAAPTDSTAPAASAH
jgi:predicted small lipoprotein YifL